ncbi:MAG: GNAT family N-acetyltransferase [Defluviitaleaceae bacterium]|nr:GNAT family N-acetyltransferase [Defluviitaleaceae bacterium]
MPTITINAAAETDIPAIESVYADVVGWLERQGYVQWTKERVSWAGLTGHFGYRLEDFYIASLDGAVAGCMVLMDRDPLFWPEIEKGRSLYIHKLAVKRFAAKKGVSAALLNFAKDEAARRGAAGLRLDTGADRPKLREMYEDAGFVCVRQNIMFGNYDVAYYVWTPEVELG